ncbi:hypothetical protein GGR57DRAFT_447528, partial [Xylariaceae sp. FL1272]
MPSSTASSHNLVTILLFAVLLISLFPGIFHYIWSISLFYLNPFSHIFPSKASEPVNLGPPPPTMWFQKNFSLAPRSRGSYLITDEVAQNLPEIKGYKVGLLNLFVQHTSCALSLNENWDDDVRADM